MHEGTFWEIYVVNLRLRAHRARKCKSYIFSNKLGEFFNEALNIYWVYKFSNYAILQSLIQDVHYALTHQIEMTKTYHAVRMESKNLG